MNVFPRQYWKKLGRIFDPEGKASWLKSHAAAPTVLTLGGDRSRIYFTPRDENGFSCSSYIEGNLLNPSSFTQPVEPILTAGELGAFDDTGIYVTSMVPHEGRLYMYTVGRSEGRSIGYRGFTGLAISEDGGKTCKRYSRAPILSWTDAEPFMAVSPWVIKEGALWRMWYTCGTKWVRLPNGSARHYYHIRYAESEDGISWKREGKICIDYANAEEYALGRPQVINEDGKYRMWFCARGAKYRLGYAESQDGITWQRDDSAILGMEPGPEAWDNEEICYPFVFDQGGKRYMLYCANGYGCTGFGLAVLES